MVTKQQGQIIAVVIAAIVATAAITYIATRTLHTTGIIKSVGIEIYTDITLTEKLTSIDWGDINVGGTAYVDCYIKNTKNTNITLSFSTTNWLPSRAQLYLSCNGDIPANKIIEPKQAVKTRITLVVSEQISDIEQFSFDIIITANEYVAH